VDWAKLFTKREIDEFIALYDAPNPNEKAIHDFLKAAKSEVSFASTLMDESGNTMRFALGLSTPGCHRVVGRGGVEEGKLR
jgi:hypothetical protein